ncbi:MMPL family transporter [Proteinivorax tanatarense]|uniref:MMPL family transporter n=1 Tax=Proteinivorax tanatarense TaxID=1260629 RepID=A0AAU7VLA8_9FIRM
MNKDIIRLYGLLAIWIIASIFLGYLSPDIDILVRKHGQLEVPEGFPTEFAKDLVEQDEGFSGEEILILYEDNEKTIINHEDKIKETLNNLQKDPGDIKIHNIITPFDGEHQRNLLVDDTKTHLIAVLELDMTTAEISFIRDELQKKTTVDGLEHYITGASIIEDDVLSTTEERLGAIEYLTVALVYIVLLAVFRSPIAPLVPLITLGSSYYLSISIVALLIDYFNFPVSNFSQVFVLTVTFAIGTDYVILLMKRYQEELAVGKDNYDTVKRTFRFTQGAVLSSALTGFVGFLAIGLANFNLYQSGVGVAVAVIVLIIAIWVWVPFIMNLFGKMIFWPTKIDKNSKNNKLWGSLGQFSTSKPALAFLLLLVIIIPLLLTFDNQRSFHSLDEIDDDYGSVKAFRKIEESYGEGDFFYHTVTIEAKDPSWDHSQRASYMEKLADNLLKIEDVEEVRTVTRPEGIKIEELRISSHAKKASDELDEVLEGVEEIQNALKQMSTELDKTITDLQHGKGDLIELIDGTESSRQGAINLHEGISETNQGVEEIKWQVSSTYNDLQTYYQIVNNIHDELLQLTDNNSLVFTPLLTLFEEVLNDIEMLTYSLVEVSQGLDQLEAGSLELSHGLDEIHQGQTILLNQYEELIAGLEEFLTAAREIEDGVAELADGMEEMQSLLFELSNQNQNVLDGFFIPDEIYQEQFQEAWDNYGTPNNNVAFLQVVSDTNPYGSRAMEIVNEIEEVTTFTLKNTPYEDVRYAVDGLPSQNRDLKRVSRDDFYRTSVYMLSGIFIVLSILFKSFIMPIYVMISLGIAYIASQSIVEFIFIDFLGYPGIMWSVPFFAFVMLMSMGVDYSIFLMARFNEEMKQYNDYSIHSIKSAMITAMKKVGGAVFSAAIILGSSFAAMMLSGVLSLLQIGTWVIVGLTFYVLILLPIFIPAVSLYLKGYNWWPFNVISWNSKTGTLTVNSKDTDNSNISIFIEGAVYNPGEYNIKDDIPLNELVEKAGGLTLKADPSQLKIEEMQGAKILNVPEKKSDFKKTEIKLKKKNRKRRFRYHYNKKQ